jgi:CO/xanthine dehydrogenase Mo-binding subunit
LNLIGTPRRRVDGRAKVTGQTKFADDVMLPRMVHAKLLRSTVPHATIARIDVSRAAAHPGVHLVLTADSRLRRRREHSQAGVAAVR